VPKPLQTFLIDPADVPAATQRRRWGQLYGAAPALALAEAAATAPGPLLVVARSALDADRLEQEIGFFADCASPVLHFPDWETLAYDAFSPHQDIISQRLEVLYRLPRLERGIVIVAAPTLLQRLPPQDYVESGSLMLAVGERLEISAFRRQLETAGYLSVPQVMEHGEFAIRGSLLDLFPMGSNHPYRIDLLDEEIDSIRCFDVNDQRTLEKTDAVRILPAREFPLTDEAIRQFRRRFRARFEGEPNRAIPYREISEGIASNGIEYYLPLFFDRLSIFFDFLPDGTILSVFDGAELALDQTWEDAQQRYESLRDNPERPILRPDEIFLDPSTAKELGLGLARTDIGSFEIPESELTDGSRNLGSATPPRLLLDSRADEPANVLLQFIEQFDGRVLLVAESAGRRETLLPLLRGHGLSAPVAEGWHDFLAANHRLAVTVAPLQSGTLLPAAGLAVIAEEQLYGDRARQRTRRRKTERDPDAIIRNLTDLHAGSPVVHEEYGVGRYIGLEFLTAGGIDGEFLTIEYAGGDKLYVPVHALNRISRYTGASPEQAPLHRLGGDQWQKARRRAAKRIRDVAAELLDLYAQRAARKGHSFRFPERDLAAFEAEFPFEETTDQRQAIEQVLDDLRAGRPMDRVVCGDVGFGKTEVALRAAFGAVQDGRQVAVLVPTTLLAQQHHQTFLDRFADWPVTIEVLSRFRSGQQSKTIVDGLRSGAVDIVIGTHKLLGGDIRFKNLGLVIIDEEHRFGVRHKERLKSLRAEVDVLTLTATPIPRTLNMALGGIRDLSLITTPPEARLAIKTFVSEWNDALIREACMREIKRGGQVYFVHNAVQTIDKIATRLRQLVPEANVRIGHGQMRERELEQVMLDFYHRRFNVLLCTTIIESGIDVPTANTIIIDRADRLGLAQLHQLRGRVGRSHHRAYAYLLTPPQGAMTAEAEKRLKAIESLEDLGAGFTLATHDLEIRGAGELLGDEQSGQIQEIGFALYMELLERAVAALQSGRETDLEAPLDHGPTIELGLPALLPENYMPDVHMRLILYKRIASATDTDTLRDLQVEMIDRFGLLPEPAKMLFRIAELRMKATPIGIRKIDANASGGRIAFLDDTPVDPLSLVELVQSDPGRFGLDGPNRLRFRIPSEPGEERITAVESVLDRLRTRPTADADGPASETE
jgi:transcription-repair coupling factor (superfamily II helicase)